MRIQPKLVKLLEDYIDIDEDKTPDGLFVYRLYDTGGGLKVVTVSATVLAMLAVEIREQLEK